MDESYTGPHQASFQRLRFEVPVLIRQTTIDLAGRLGFMFQDGWTYPLIIHFVDSTPLGTENVLAYVALETDGQHFRQRLDINLAAYERNQFDFPKVFAHELVHAMMNDAVGAEAGLLLPVWVHEGLAVYGAEQGEKMLQAYVRQTMEGDPVRALLNGLEGPHGAYDYAEDYLAFKYLYQAHGGNSLHNFVREVVYRKGDIPGSLQYTCSEDWPTFQKNARRYSEKEIERLTNSMRSGKAENPY